MKGQYQNNISELRGISDKLYESIFKLYRDGTHYTYNILQQVSIPDDIDPLMVQEITITSEMPYSVLSYNVYGSIQQWWLICLVNNIDDPTKMLPTGTKIKVIKPQFVGQVLGMIKSQLPK
jgi:hypothetical protein